eukprot:7701641-Prorocentrum_lima.AAC.1
MSHGVATQSFPAANMIDVSATRCTCANGLSMISYSAPVYPLTHNNLHTIWSSLPIWRQPDD